MKLNVISTMPEVVKAIVRSFNEAVDNLITVCQRFGLGLYTRSALVASYEDQVSIMTEFFSYCCFAA